MPANDPPTNRQLTFIKRLAYQRGISFIPPPTRAQASRLIDQLRGREPSPAYEIRTDRDQTTALHGEHAPSSSARKDEIVGHGSTARWRHSRPPHRR